MSITDVGSSASTWRAFLAVYLPAAGCQVAVFAALGAAERVSLVGARLYLPQQWCEDPARCKQARIPVEDRVFKSKSTLALELITHLRGIGVQFAATALDAGYGKEPGLLRALDDADELFVVEVHSSQRIWRDDPWPAAHLPRTSHRTTCCNQTPADDFYERPGELPK